jgi:maleylacetate reductase
VIATGAAFTHTSLPARVVFGRGTLPRVVDEVERLGLSRVLVLCTPGQTEQGEQVAALLAGLSVGVYAEAVMHVPTDVAAAAVEHARATGADGCLAVGGGSSVGLGKAIALETGLPLLAAPTTYAGSEMTPVWGLTGAAGKRTGRDLRVLPVSVVYDVDLTMGLPVEISVTSAVNALAHAVEATYAPDGSPLIDVMAREAATTLYAGAKRIATDPHDTGARTQLLYGAWLAGCCLGATTMSLHHKLCHIIGGSFDLSHAWTHTVILPYVMAFNLRRGTRSHALMAEALADDQPGTALWETLTRLGWMRSLADLGMPGEGVDHVVDQATASPYANPYDVTADDVRDLVGAAWRGEAPAANADHVDAQQ